MVDTSLFEVPQFKTNAQIEDEQRQRERQEPGFLGTVAAAADLEWIPFSFYEAMKGAQFDNDPKFEMDDDLWEHLTANVDPAYHPSLASARSLDHAWYLKSIAQRRTNSAQMLQDAGWMGVPTRMIVGALDPVEFTTDAITGGVAAYLTAGKNISRMARFGIMGASAATTVGLTEGARAALDPTRDLTDVLGAMGISFALGGGLGAWLSPKGADDLARWQNRVRKQLDEIADGDFTDDAIRAADAAMGGDMTLNAQHSFWGGPGQEAAEGAIADIMLSNVTDASDEMAPWYGAFRWGMVGRGTRSEVPEVRKLVRMLAEDTVPLANDDLNVMSALEGIDFGYRKFVSQSSLESGPSFGAYIKANDIPWMKRGHAYLDWGQEIGKAIRNAADDGPLWAVDGANAYRRQFRFGLMLAKRAGVTGWENIAEDPTYFPRLFLPSAFQDKTQLHGGKAVEGFWSRAYLSDMPSLDVKHTDKWARALMRRQRRAPFDVDIDFHRMIMSAEGDDLKMYLMDFLGNEADEAEVDDMLRAITADRAAIAKDSRARRRLPLDELYEETLPTTDGGTAVLRVSDFLDNDAPRVTANYMRTVYGLAYERKILDAMTPEGRNPFPSWDALMQHMREEASKNIEPNSKPHAKFKRDMKRLDVLHRALMGTPQADISPGMRHAIRFVKNWQIGRAGGKLGFANMVEVGRVQAELGTNIMIQSMPAFGDIVVDATKGRMPTALIDEIQRMSAPEIASLSHMAVRNRYTDIGGLAGYVQDAVGITDKIAEGTMKLSGFRYVDRFTRTACAAGYYNQWLSYAMKGNLPSAKRLAVIGIDADMAKRITEQVRAHATEWTGEVGKKSKLLNLQNWDDAEAAAHFLIGGDKFVNRVVQQANIGQMTPWMTHPLASVVLQWRNFMLSAWEKKLLFDIAMHDRTAFQAWGTELLMGGLMGAALVYVNSAGRPDAEEYRKKMLTPGMIASGAFRRAGWPSIIPGVVDNGMALMGEDKIFNPWSTTTTGSGMLSELPIVNLFDDAYTATRGTLAAAVNPDIRYTQLALNSTRRLLFFNNLTGIQNVLNALLPRDLPYNEQVPGTED